MQGWRFPTHYQLISGLVTAVGVGAVSSVLFIHGDFMPSRLYVLAISLALSVTSLEVANSISQAVRSALGTLVGAAAGLVVHSITRSMVTDTTHTMYLSTLFSFPFAAFFSMAEDYVSSPLAWLIRADSAYQGLYLTTTFSKDGQPYQSARDTVICLCVGAAISLSVTLAFRMVFSEWSSVARFRRALMRFSTETVRVFEALVAYMMSGPDHLAEVQRRLRKLELSMDNVLMASQRVDAAVWWEFPQDVKTDLLSVVNLIPSQLLAVQRAMDAKYAPVIFRELWAPVEPVFSELASVVCRNMRPDGDEYSELEIGILCDELNQLLIDRVKSLDQNPKESETPDLLRFVFAMISVIRFVRLANRMVKVRAELHNYKPRMSVTRCLWAVHSVVGGLFDVQRWKSSFSKEKRYPFKIAFAHQCLLHCLIAWNRSSPEGVARNAFWAATPLFVCLLPTVGGSIVKGFRRILGAGIGGCFGLFSVVCTGNSDIMGLVVQLLLVSFLSKLFSFVTSISYAAAVAGPTWIVVTLANFSQPLTDAEYITYALNRIILAVVGACAAAVLGVLVFPRFALLLNREAHAELIKTAFDLAEKSVSAVLSDRCVIDGGISVSAETLIQQYSFDAGFEAHNTLRQSDRERKTLREDTEGELITYRILTGFVRPSTSTLSTRRVLDLAPRVDRLMHAALVLFGCSAGTLLRDDVMALVRDRGVGLSVGMRLIVEELRTQMPALCECFRTPGKVDISALGPLTSAQKLDERFFALRASLIENDTNALALEGGILRLYTFLFCLAEFAEAWANLSNAVTPSRTLFRHLSTSLKRDFSANTV
jgi:hypothetical protein